MAVRLEAREGAEVLTLIVIPAIHALVKGFGLP